MAIGFFQLYCSFHIVCVYIYHSVWTLTTSRRLQEAVCVEGNSARGRHVALGPQRKPGPHILRQFLGPQKYTLTTDLFFWTQLSSVAIVTPKTNSIHLGD